MITIKEFFDKETFTLTYCVWHAETRDAVIIDPVHDYDIFTSKVSSQSVGNFTHYALENKIKLHFVLETHAHADHLSGAQEIKGKFAESKIGVGKEITQVQKTFAKIFNLNIPTDGVQFDKLFTDQETVKAGKLEFKVIFTPGHTPACVSYLFEDALFTGDALFMPDYGVGRCDFPDGSAKTLYESVTKKIFALPDKTRVFTGHDYQPNNRALKFESTIEEEKKLNIHINEKTTLDAFVKFRTERDNTLKAPRLLYPSIQINIDAGRLPKLESNGTSYLKVPLLV